MKVESEKFGSVHWVGGCSICCIDLTEDTAKKTQYACRKHTLKTGHGTNYESGSSIHYSLK